MFEAKLIIVALCAAAAVVATIGALHEKSLHKRMNANVERQLR